MSRPDTVTRAMLDRLVKSRASVLDKVVLLAMIRAAIDVTMAGDELFSEDALGAVEETIRSALAMVVDP